MGAPGWAERMRRYIGAMPDTACRVLPRRTKVFQAAIIGRGSIVVMTVSSMSLTIPWSRRRRR